jgi:DeoR/GlpR family transcriptional regulator of sugar metabolism
MPDIPLNVVTVAIESYHDLARKQNVTAVLSGGIMNRDTQNLVGSITVEVVRKFSFSTCFISADGFDFTRGSLELDCEESMVKKAMIDASEQVILLIDSSKILNRKGIVTCPVEKITHIITDRSTEGAWPEEFNQKLIYV